MKKNATLPILVIIPHGGLGVPEELSGYEAVGRFDLFMQSDTCANDIFSFGDLVAGTVDTDISRLFVDLDRPYTALRPGQDSVIKKETLDGKPVFDENHFPDEIAIANIIQRYYLPFHDTVKKIIDTGGVGLVLECHTSMAVGPKLSRDAGKPRPLVLLEYAVRGKEGPVDTCDPVLIEALAAHLDKSFQGEECTVTQKIIASTSVSGGYILRRYGTGSVPMIRLSLSRALFLDDSHFSFEYMRVDERRLRHLREILWSALSGFFRRHM
ncbi:MAG: N-formylglutamate amidohydrolase [Spirochaetes bacterium]|nr:N-formylglutamate amidohydrolase [Spirochaetota bacterium]